jgi:hypothetical protein
MTWVKGKAGGSIFPLDFSDLLKKIKYKVRWLRNE